MSPATLFGGAFGLLCLGAVAGGKLASAWWRTRVEQADRAKAATDELLAGVRRERDAARADVADLLQRVDRLTRAHDAAVGRLEDARRAVADIPEGKGADAFNAAFGGKKS
jgi:hypothetical protein